ncbi:MAG: protein kinase [Thermoanaerobaculia bacterium]
MTLAPGTRLGSYEVLSPLGAGGMGEVYQAKDTRLERRVALKVLPEEFFEDNERVARFEREARLLAALNHPSIAAIYSFEESGGRHLLAMELVEGDGLDTKIAAGPLALEDSMSIARQIAEALEAAHEKGIVHRDLKPANVKVSEDGKVKVLDFGLAKIFGEDSSKGTSGSGLAESPTLTARATAAGVILGTAAYMSPEQARGKSVDKRTDVWAFGCVLYEMLTGRRAFEGETVSDTLAAVLKEDPNWAVLPEQTPTRIKDLLKRCLRREAKQRLHDIADARLELEEATAARQAAAGVSGTGSFPFEEKTASPSPTLSRSEATKHGRGSKNSLYLSWAIAAACAAAAGALALRARAPATVSGPRTLTASLLCPEGWSLDPLAGPPAFSPDGTRLAFVVHDSGGRSALGVRSLDSGELRILPDTEGSRNPFWSPDSRSIGFSSQSSGLSMIPAAGGAIEPIAPTGPGRGATWNRDGVILYSPSLLSSIFRLTLADRKRVAVTTLDEKRGESVHHWPQFLPDGRHFLFVVQRVDPTTRRSESEVYVQALDSKEKKLLVRVGSRTVYAPPGFLLYVWDGNLMAQPFDAGSLSLTGDAFVLVRHVQFLADGSAGIFSASNDGLLAYAEGGTIGLAQLMVFDRRGKEIRTVGAQDNMWSPHLSPDGRRVAVEVIDRVSNNRDIWTFDVTGQEPPTRVTFDPGEDYTPVFSPDGNRIAFSSFRKGIWTIFQKKLAGSEEEEAIASGSSSAPARGSGTGRYIAPGSKFLTDWSRDGRLVAFNGSTAETSDDMWVLSVAEGMASPFLVTPAMERDTVFSPDGRWAAYISSESGRSEIYVRAFPGPGGKWQISTAGGIQPRWRADGKELYYVAPGGWLTAVPVRTNPSFEKGTPQALFQTRGRRTNIAQYDVFPDGQRFIVNTVIVEKSGSPLTLVQNWLAQVKVK